MEFMLNINQTRKNKMVIIFTSMKASFLKTIKMDLECNGASIVFS